MVQVVVSGASATLWEILDLPLVNGNCSRGWMVILDQSVLSILVAE